MNVFDQQLRRKAKWRAPKVRDLPVRWYNLPLWVLKTAVVDLRDYRRGAGAAPSSGGGGNALREPVLLVGAPRSGTSYLGGCIGAMAAISYHREPVLTKASTKHVHRGDWNFEHAARIYRSTYRGLLALHRAGDRRFAEKTPQNAFVVDFLASAFPAASFVHIVRDGRDAALSFNEKPWARQVFAYTRRREPGGHPYGPFAPFWVEPERVAEYESTSDLHRAAWTWRAHVEAALAAGARLPADRWLEVRYEELQYDRDAVGAQVLDFLRVEDPAERDRFRAALATGRDESIGRWRDRLDSEGLRVVEHEAGALLDRLGYA